jgi:hypothetical protein
VFVILDRKQLAFNPKGTPSLFSKSAGYINIFEKIACPINHEMLKTQEKLTLAIPIPYFCKKNFLRIHYYYVCAKKSNSQAGTKVC